MINARWTFEFGTVKIAKLNIKKKKIIISLQVKIPSGKICLLQIFVKCPITSQSEILKEENTKERYKILKILE